MLDAKVGIDMSAAKAMTAHDDERMNYTYELVHIEDRIMIHGEVTGPEELIRQLLLLRAGGWRIVTISAKSDCTSSIARGIQDYIDREGKNAEQTSGAGTAANESEQRP